MVPGTPPRLPAFVGTALKETSQPSELRQRAWGTPSQGDPRGMSSVCKRAREECALHVGVAGMHPGLSWVAASGAQETPLTNHPVREGTPEKAA